MHELKILLVDDHPDFLTGLQNLLEAEGFTVVGTANSAARAIAMTRTLHPDLILMDVKMPGKSGIAAAKSILQLFPSVRIIMLTVSLLEADLFEAIHSGASGYLLKSTVMNDFSGSLQSLLQQNIPISQQLMPKLWSEIARTMENRAQSAARKAAFEGQLSARQTHILRLLARGNTYPEIAQNLSLSERTIKYEVREIADQLQLENRAQVLAWASRYLYLEK